MRVNWKHVAITLAILPFAAILVAWIGFFNVGASTGHWKITNWFLHLAMRSAVRTYALAVDVPEELPREAIQPAAGHYARGCAICHGAPGEPRSPVVMRMLPQPPDLSANVGQWTDAQLFRIVKHGVRFTGMPAWPTLDRNDEVWEMVAFLRELPSLDAATYRSLAYGVAEASNGAASHAAGSLADCVRCHGPDGLGRSPAVPVIAGQSETYLLESLRAYARNDRASGFMTSAVNAAEPDELPALARYFAALPSRPTPATAEISGLIAAGEAIAKSGRPEARVPACLSCHEAAGRNPIFPHLSGQNAAYIEAQLKLFRAGQRGGTAYNHLMSTVAKELTDDDIPALAAYFASRDKTGATANDGHSADPEETGATVR